MEIWEALCVVFANASDVHQKHVFGMHNKTEHLQMNKAATEDGRELCCNFRQQFKDGTKLMIRNRCFFLFSHGSRHSLEEKQWKCFRRHMYLQESAVHCFWESYVYNLLQDLNGSAVDEKLLLENCIYFFCVWFGAHVLPEIFQHRAEKEIVVFRNVRWTNYDCVIISVLPVEF